jgi:very-short-patch-repair endonuclease
VQATHPQLAKVLRHNPTEAEKKLWRHLRNRQVADQKFRRQQPYGPYILDFYCAEAKLVIELDGGQHGIPSGKEHDEARDAFLRAEGLTVLRFWNNSVVEEFEAVMQTIHAPWRASPSPKPSPPRGEG